MNKWTSFPIVILFCTSLFAKVGVIVNKDIFPDIRDAVTAYAEDVKNIENIEVWIDGETFSETNSVKQLKDLLVDKYHNDELEGVIFLGDLPIAQYYNPKDFFNKTAQFACDLYYMDLDGSFSAHNGSDYIFTNHTGNKAPEIWLSRHVGSVVENYLGYEADLYNNYFKRVQNRMYGIDKQNPRKYVIAGQKNEWGGLENENIGDLPYDQANIDKYTGNCGSKWKAALIDGREYGFIYSHSDETKHNIGFNINDIVNNDIDCRFYNCYACSNGNYTKANMGTVYALSHNGLISVGSSKTGSMCPGKYKAYNKPLGEGKSFGEAYKAWFSMEGISLVEWHYGMSLFGVGTLKVRPYSEATSTKKQSYTENSLYNLRVLGSEIYYQIPYLGNDRQKVSLKLYSIKGELIQTLFNCIVKFGQRHIATFDKLNTLASGLYMCRMETGGFSKTVSVVVK